MIRLVTSAVLLDSKAIGLALVLCLLFVPAVEAQDGELCGTSVVEFVARPTLDPDVMEVGWLSVKGESLDVLVDGLLVHREDVGLRGGFYTLALPIPDATRAMVSLRAADGRSCSVVYASPDVFAQLDLLDKTPRTHERHGSYAALETPRDYEGERIAMYFHIRQPSGGDEVYPHLISGMESMSWKTAGYPESGNCYGVQFGAIFLQQYASHVSSDGALTFFFGDYGTPGVVCSEALLFRPFLVDEPHRRPWRFQQDGPLDLVVTLTERLDLRYLGEKALQRTTVRRATWASIKIEVDTLAR
jgi:hypothetical protein